MSTLSIIELVAVAEGEQLYWRIADILNTRLRDMYALIDSAIPSAYSAGLISILEQYQVEFTSEIPSYDHINTLVTVARHTLANRHYDTMQKMGESLKLSIVQDWDASELTEALSTIFTQFLNHTDAIVRTETNRAGNIGRADAMQYLGIQYSKIYTQEDDRVCEHTLIINILGQVKGCSAFWTGEHKLTVIRNDDIIYVLPLHPRCRCYSLPVARSRIR